MSSITPIHLVGPVAAAALISAAAAQPYSEHYWRRAYPEQRSAFQMLTYDDGSGPAVYMRTHYNSTAQVLRLMRDGEWQVIENGLRPWVTVLGMRTLDDGSGPRLYMLGSTHTQKAGFEVRLSCWDGAQWNQVWPEMYSCTNGRCKAPVTSVDLGSGMHIYGIEDRSSNVAAVLRWDGAQWTEIGLANRIPSLYAFDLGDGPGLYALGGFTTIGGVQSRSFARWTGSTWVDLSNPEYGIQFGSAPTVVYNDGTGPAIYTINHISHLGQPLPGVKRWTGSAWEVVGAEILPPNVVVGYHDLVVHDDGTGPGLYVTGGFHSINGVPARSIARYDATGWSALGPGFGSAYQMGSLQMIHGPSLVVSKTDFFPVYIHQWVGRPNCYANCDLSTTEPILNIDDFTCFVNAFSHGLTYPGPSQINDYANCDQSTTAPVLNIDDFMCFINKFAAGCP